MNFFTYIGNVGQDYKYLNSRLIHFRAYISTNYITLPGTASWFK